MRIRKKLRACVKIFGYSVSNGAEKIAFNQGLNLLEKRVKFLSQTENPKLKSKLDGFASIRSEFEEIHQNIEEAPIADGSLILASQSRATTSSNANKNKKKTTASASNKKTTTANKNTAKKSMFPMERLALLFILLKLLKSNYIYSKNQQIRQVKPLL